MKKVIRKRKVNGKTIRVTITTPPSNDTGTGYIDEFVSRYYKQIPRDLLRKLNSYSELIDAKQYIDNKTFKLISEYFEVKAGDVLNYRYFKNKLSQVIGIYYLNCNKERVIINFDQRLIRHQVFSGLYHKNGHWVYRDKIDLPKGFSYYKLHKKSGKNVVSCGKVSEKLEKTPDSIYGKISNIPCYFEDNYPGVELTHGQKTIKRRKYKLTKRNLPIRTVRERF